MFKKLYEQNIGLVNGVAAEWLIDISETIDCEMFKRAMRLLLIEESAIKDM